MEDSSPILLVSDVDDTLLGDSNALARFSAWFTSNRQLVRLVYASGRFYESVAASVHSTALPAPDAIAGGVGTQVHLYPSGQAIPEWKEQLPDGWDPELVRHALADFPGLVLQPERFLSPTKISYYLDNATTADIDEIHQRLRNAQVQADIIYSSNRDLDVVPQGVNKGAAASFFADLWAFDPEQVVVVGDSANDLSMFQQGFRGIVIANAHPEVQAQNGRGTFHTPYARADGVLDGVAYWLNQQLN